MDKKEQRIAIAEACGWTIYNKELLLGHSPNVLQYKFDPRRNSEELPDYLDDLNAMHEAEKARDWFNAESQEALVYWDTVNEVLATQRDGRINICVTASQRAEAFLKTLNLWKD